MIRRRNLDVKSRSKYSEREAAKEIGGKLQPASGSIAAFKGDVKSKEFLLEDKFTDAASYSLQLGILKKIEGEAFRAGRTPLLRVTIKGETFYVLTKRAFLKLRQNEKTD